MTRTDRLAVQLVHACRELLRRKPWDVFPDEACFQMAVPTGEHPLSIVIRGLDGVDMGLTVSRGADGLARGLRAVFTPEVAELQQDEVPECLDRWDHLDLNMVPFGNIPARLRGVLERGGFRGRRETLAPMIYSKHPGQPAGPPSRHDLRALQWCLVGMFAGMDAGVLKPAAILRGQPIERLEVTGSLSQPEVRARTVPWGEALGGTDLLNDITLPGDYADLTPEQQRAVPVEYPQTLAEWKLADKHFTACMRTELTGDSGLLSPRAFRRYFGDDQTGVDVMRELANLCPEAALTEWLAADYRATKRSKTWLEKLLQRKRAPAVQRAIAQARCDAESSIYRVEATNPGSSILVEDLLSGERVSAHDTLLSGSLKVGMFLPLRLMKLGEWVFPLLSGPGLSAYQIDQAMYELERCGLPPSATSLRPHADLSGRLWGWCLRQRGQLPEVRNTDADPLVWQKVSYQVASPDALVAALGQRSDVECTSEGSEWTWVRRGQRPGRLEDSVSLCHFELLGDELLLEANSVRRLASARAWVDALPGVSFLTQSSRSMDELRAERSLDDRLPKSPEPPMPPEVLEELGRILREKQLAWLDEPVPMLGGFTPRQACADAAGRRRVERLIRSMPATITPGGQIEPPRQELLEALGLA
ncbi:MAG: hypothetical protein DRQ55_02210 [Planctomycetota bacterium]|nr:MAG: hypothetical protein DRQ55_02210 [Planctomycetota bacterium]